MAQAGTSQREIGRLSSIDAQEIDKCAGRATTLPGEESVSSLQRGAIAVKWFGSFTVRPPMSPSSDAAISCGRTTGRDRHRMQRQRAREVFEAPVSATHAIASD